MPGRPKKGRREVTAILIGDLAGATAIDDLPAHGIVIEATKEEIQNLPPILYREVEVNAKE